MKIEEKIQYKKHEIEPSLVLLSEIMKELKK
jgi:hypothetical protein